MWVDAVKRSKQRKIDRKKEKERDRNRKIQ